MREVKRKRALPLYITAVFWALLCLIFPIWRMWQFIRLLIAGGVVYLLASKLFPALVEYEEEPPEPEPAPRRTGDEKLDALLEEGELAVAEMRRLKCSIPNEAVRARIAEIVDVTEKIFADLYDDPQDYRQVKHFANYYLPTTVKLLHAYDRMSSQGIQGDNITGTIDRIESILDTTAQAYRKQLDALFLNQAIDIDSDITVLEGMLKREGLSGGGIMNERNG